jgi:hypothetical protein
VTIWSLATGPRPFQSQRRSLVSHGCRVRAGQSRRTSSLDRREISHTGRSGTLSRCWAGCSGSTSYGPVHRPQAPPLNLPGTCSRTLLSTTLPSDSDRLLSTPRWPCDHFNPPEAGRRRGIDQGWSVPVDRSCGLWVRGYRVTTPEHLSGRPRTSAPHLYRLRVIGGTGRSQLKNVSGQAALGVVDPGSAQVKCLS